MLAWRWWPLCAVAACSGASSDPVPVAQAPGASASVDVPPPPPMTPPAPPPPPFTPAPHLAWPAIPSHGGHVLDPLRVVTVIAEDEPYAAELQAFGDALPTSKWYASFAAEYGLSGAASHVLVKGPHVDAGASFTQAQMNAYIASAAPAPDGHTVYVLFLPPGTVLDDGGTPDTKCAKVPYHTGYGTLGDGMAVVNRCLFGFPSQLEMFEVDAAHEIAEAATDSNPTKNPAWELWSSDLAKPWTSSVWNEVEMESSAEIGDVCIFTRYVENGFTYQRVFSDAAAKGGGDPCVPAIAAPYFGVSPDPKTSGWIAVTAGATVDVPLTGWSTAATSDWLVWADAGKGHAGGTFAASVESATTARSGKYTFATTNDGKDLVLHVTAPPGVASGWWGAVELWSWHADASGAYVAGEDFGHESVVGFYVP